MKKLNQTIYNKLLAQGEEAKERGLETLGTAVMGSLTANPEEARETYASGQLETDIYEGLWKLATNVLKYHEVESADVEKIDQVIGVLAEKFVEEVEVSLGIEPGTLGKAEPPVMGEKYVE